MGIEIVLEPQHVTIRAVPLPLRQQNLQNLIPELIGYRAANIVGGCQHRAVDRPPSGQRTFTVEYGAGDYRAGGGGTPLPTAGESAAGWVITTC